MKTAFSILLLSVVVFASSSYTGSTKAVVTLVGGMIKNQHIENNVKFKRKDCPVCKGAGKYLSGDGIKMVDCGYCEPETKDIPSTNRSSPIISSPKPICNGPECHHNNQRPVIIKRY
jgi:hypothetical protein